ncbi:MAG: protein kinase [Planctomycetes bacterium]|nr:protein kinase [Planctomycetota bacterium]
MTDHDLPADDIDALNGKTIGPCRIERLIGRGAMSAVYVGTHLKFETPVAVKILADVLADDPEYVARFRREARSLAKLQHSNIVTVYDFGEQGGHEYIVMRFVDGMSVKDLITRDGRLGFERAFPIMRDVLRGLDYAHERGFIHRDIKPSNILLDAQGSALLADFGLVKQLDSEHLTMAGEGVGTPHYMSPEQWDGADPTPQMDIWSAGVTFYHMLTGRVPFEGTGASQVIKNITVSSPAPLSAHGLPVPGGLQAVLDRMLAKEPGDRYTSAAAVLADIEALAGIPASSPAPAAAPAPDVPDSTLKVPRQMGPTEDSTAPSASATVRRSRPLAAKLLLAVLLVAGVGGLAAVAILLYNNYQKKAHAAYAAAEGKARSLADRNDFDGALGVLRDYVSEDGRCAKGAVAAQSLIRGEQMDAADWQSLRETVAQHTENGDFDEALKRIQAFQASARSPRYRQEAAVLTAAVQQEKAEDDKISPADIIAARRDAVDLARTVADCDKIKAFADTVAEANKFFQEAEALSTRNRKGAALKRYRAAADGYRSVAARLDDFRAAARSRAGAAKAQISAKPVVAFAGTDYNLAEASLKESTAAYEAGDFKRAVTLADAATQAYDSARTAGINAAGIAAHRHAVKGDTKPAADIVACLLGADKDAALRCLRFMPDATASQVAVHLSDMGVLSEPVLVEFAGVYSACRKNGTYDFEYGACVRAVAFSGDGRRVALGGNANNAVIVDMMTGRKTFLPSPFQSRTEALCFSPDGARLAVCEISGNLCLWDTATARLLWKTSNPGLGESVSFSPDGKFIAAAFWNHNYEDYVQDGKTKKRIKSWHNWLRIYEAVSGTELLCEEKDGCPRAAYARFLGNGRLWIAGVVPGNSIAILNRRTANRMEYTVLQTFNNDTSYADFSGDGSLALLGNVLKAELLSLGTNRSIATYRYGAPLALSRDGSVAATSFCKDIFTNGPGRRPGQIHYKGYVKAVAFSPDGDFVLAGMDGITDKSAEANTAILHYIGGASARP